MTASITTIEKLEVICEDMKKRSEPKATNMTGVECNASPSPELQTLASLEQKCRSYKDSVEVMQNRVGKLIDLVSPTRRSLTSPVLMRPNKLADGLKEKSQGLTASISNSLLDLTRRSVDDNATVRIVTVITLIYLPTQFVAVSSSRRNARSS